MASLDHASSPAFVSMSASSPSVSIPLNPFSISPNAWLIAEKRAEEILSQIEPTEQSEQCRRSIVQYLQSLLETYLGVQILPFGSLPLKTYLSDGDIDLTTVSSHIVEEALVKNIHALLEAKEMVPDGFEVTDVHFIDAEVKLIKCLVQNIVVDISFNQFGGISTFCFFEEVDRLIGKDHLFKRSVILIKAWSYYESRILGAHHGLMSTYALETLVLYIFQLFHASLDGPLSVLYRFLDYYSKFDWDNYCISLSGPVYISFFSQTMAMMPQDDLGELLLSEEFLKTCVDTLAVPPKGCDTNSHPFLPKHLNIIDPLKENNNLGRSVSKGNAVRIRLAFTYGARKLSQILSQPDCGRIVHELNSFFKKTLDRNVTGQRRDVQDSLPVYVTRALRQVSQKTGEDGMRISGTRPTYDILGLRPTAYTWEDMYVGYDECDELGATPGEASSSLLDLGADYGSHLLSLQFVQDYNDVSSGELPESLPSQIQSILSSYLMNQQPITQDVIASGVVEAPTPSPLVSLSIGTGMFLRSVAHGTSSSQAPPHSTGGPMEDQEAERERSLLGPSPIGTEMFLTSVAHGTSSSQAPPHSTGGLMMDQEAKKERSLEELLEEEFPPLPSRARPQPVASVQTDSQSPMEEVNNAGALSVPQADKLDNDFSFSHHLEEEEEFPALFNFVCSQPVASIQTASQPPMEEVNNADKLEIEFCFDIQTASQPLMEEVSNADKLEIEFCFGHHLEEEFPALSSLVCPQPVACIQTASQAPTEEVNNAGALSVPQAEKLDTELSFTHNLSLAAPSSEERASSELDATNAIKPVSPEIDATNAIKPVLVTTYKLKNDEDFPHLNHQPSSLAAPSSEECASLQLDAMNAVEPVPMLTYKLKDDEDFPALNLAVRKIIRR